MVDAGGDEISLEFTPSWVVALVCFSIVLISILVDKFLLCASQLLEKYEMRAFLGALRKIKDELMVLGFISLLLPVFQARIGKICISEQLANTWLPCKKPDPSSTVASFATSSFASSGTRGRHLLAEASNTTDYCSQKGKVALLSVEALHHLDIFIFALAIFHVVFCAIEVLIMMIHWRKLGEYDKRRRKYDNPENAFKTMLEDYKKPSWVVFPCVTEFEYNALRLNFMVAHNLKNIDFWKYIISTVQKEFEGLFRISWYLWLCAVIFLLVNVAGWNAYFWISFIPLTLLLIVGINLEFMIKRLTRAIAKKHTPKEKDSPSKESEKHTPKEKDSPSKESEKAVVKISDDDFWLGRPHLVGYLMHIVLFVNSLELAFFFFILFQYGFRSCIMGKVGFVVPRIVLGWCLQLQCISRTSPLYAIMKTQFFTDKQLDEQNMYLKENQSDEHKRENQTEEEEEMWIVTMTSKWIESIPKWRDYILECQECIRPAISEPRLSSMGVSVGAGNAESGDTAGDIEGQDLSEWDRKLLYPYQK